MLLTAFTRGFGVGLPIVGAPMDGVSFAELAAAVAKAGGLGFIAAGIQIPIEQIPREMETAKGLVAGEDPEHSAIGIGLMNFWASPERLNAAIACWPHTIWLSFSEALEDWEPPVRAVKEAGIKLICQVQHVEQALYVAKLGADAIVAQGYEAGGHGASHATTFCFTPEVVDALRAEGFSTPVLAAGGVADGRQVAAALALGADGVVVGTRLAATQESRYPAFVKDAYVGASDAWQGRPSSVRTTLWDELGRGPGGSRIPWPSGIDGRALENRVSQARRKTAVLTEEDKVELNAMLADGKAGEDAEQSCIWSGGGVGLVHFIAPAEQVVRQMAADAEKVLARLGSGAES